MTKLTEWIKANPKLAAYMFGVVLTLLTAMTGLQFTSRAAQPGESPGIIIVLPEDSPDVFGSVVGAESTQRFSETGRRALRLAGAEHVRQIARLKREDENDRRFFAMLTAIHNNPELIATYEQAANVKGFDPVTISIAVRIALKVAIAILERRAPETATEWDDRLLKLLVLFEGNPFVIPGR
jgi:hypothetical protein